MVEENFEFSTPEMPPKWLNMTAFLEILTSGGKIERVSTAATDKIQGQQEVPPYHIKSPLKEKSPLNF